MEPQKKHILNLTYTKARIKPFLNPLFWGSSLIVSVFFYGLWQYATNPDLFIRESAGPTINGNEPQNASTTPNTGQIQQGTPSQQVEQIPSANNTDNEPLTAEDLANLADIDNIGSLFQEVELNPLLSPKRSKSNSKDNSENNLFQKVAESDNLGINNSDANEPNSEIKKIEVIKPNAQLPSLQDLTERQRAAVQQDTLKQAVQNTSPIFLDSKIVPNQFNGANNNNFNNINPNSQGINNSNANYLTPDPVTQINPYNSLGYNNPYTINPQTTNPQTIEQNNNNLSGFSQGLNNNPANIQTNPYQNNNFNNNNLDNNNLDNNNIIITDQNQQPEQPQQPARQPSKVLYYY